jgi:hypothetical protein
VINSHAIPSGNVYCIFHVILLAYLLASLLFWLSMGLQQRWIFQFASWLLGEDSVCKRSAWALASLYRHGRGGGRWQRHWGCFPGR